MNGRRPFFEAVQPGGAREDKGDDEVPQRVDEHAQEADARFAREVHVGLQDLGENGDEKERNFGIEEGDGEPFPETLYAGSRILVKQAFVVGVPHRPAVPEQQRTAHQLQARKDGGRFFQHHDEPVHG